MMAKRLIEIGIAFALIYTAVIWIVFEFLPLSDLDRIRLALWWWLPGIVLLIGVVTLLARLGEKRTRLILGVSMVYGSIILYISIGEPSQFLNLFFSFIVGALLVTGLTLLLIRPSTIDCPHCGASNPDRHEFCSKCGNKLKP